MLYGGFLFQFYAAVSIPHFSKGAVQHFVVCSPYRPLHKGSGTGKRCGDSFDAGPGKELSEPRHSSRVPVFLSDFFRARVNFEKGAGQHAWPAVAADYS